MANTQIDELRLDISIEDKTNGESSSKKVRDLATAISRLNTSISNFDATKMAQTFSSITSSIKPLTRELKSASKELQNLATVAKTSGLNNLAKGIAPALPKGKASTLGQADSQVGKERGGSNDYGDLNKSAQDLNDSMSKLGDSIEKSNKAHNKLLKSFGRIALYRAIRSVLKQITQAFIDSTNAIAQYDSEFSDAISSLKSSLTKVKFSIGVAFYQILISLAPTINNIANSVAGFANSISKVSARLRGTNKYLAINLDYLQEIQKQAKSTLLSFDTFETLGTSSDEVDYDKLFEPKEDALDDSKLTEREKSLLGIYDVLKDVWAMANELWAAIKDIGRDTLSIIQEILGTGIIQSIVHTTAEIVNLLGELGLLKSVVVGLISLWVIIKGYRVYEAISRICVSTLNLVSGITQLTAAMKAFSVVTLSVFGFILGKQLGDTLLGLFENKALGGEILFIAGAIVALGSALAYTFGILTFGTSLAIAAVALGVAIAGFQAWHAETNGLLTSTFADGGMFDGAGTMYALAGEAGPEVVAQGSAGTGVLNVEQFADAMVSALVRYGAARDNGSGSVIEIDGNRLGTLIASNAGFRNEINRRNAGLNLR